MDLSQGPHSPPQFLISLCFLLFLSFNMLFYMYMLHSISWTLFIFVVCVKNV